MASEPTKTTDSPRQATIRKARDFVRSIVPEGSEDEVNSLGLLIANKILYIQLSITERKRKAAEEAMEEL